MLRYFALLGLHFLINFGVVADNVVVSHPVHHDDYANLATSFADVRVASARPLSTLAIAALAELGEKRAYLLLNLGLVACVMLCLRLVELLVRNGRPLPVLGFVAAGALALEAPTIVDWTKYLGLITNLTSALAGLASMCALAAAANHAQRERALMALAALLAAISFFSKEDFGAPVVALAVVLALSLRSRTWMLAAVAMAALFVAAVSFNRLVGSVFVSGTAAPTDPYFVDLSPASLLVALSRMLLASAHAQLVVAAALVTVAIAIIVNRSSAALAVRFAALPALAACMLAANAIFPNHAFAYYAFVPIALLCGSLAAAAYAIGERPVPS